MKIVVAIDSFKGSASSAELNEAVRSEILKMMPACEVATFAIADGGEGTIAALQAGLGGELISVDTLDLLRRPIQAQYLLINDLAVIEVAQVVGIDKIQPSVQTIQSATTFGLANLILDAKNRGVREILLALGGSGSSDGGLGLLQGLKINLSNLTESVVKFDRIKLTALADVTNPYAGKTGYAQIFGPQKGGTAEILAQQDQDAQKFAAQVKTQLGLDLQKIPGTGAAGGLGAAVAILGGTIRPGFPEIAALLKIEKALRGADLLITGEGRMDAQTAQGKVPFGMATLAAKYQVPTLAFCGALADDLGKMDELLLASFSIQRSALPLAQAMQKDRTLANLQLLTRNVLKTWLN